MRYMWAKHRIINIVALIGLSATLAVGCRTTKTHRGEADEAARKIIEEKQQQALGRQEPFTIETPADTLRRRLLLDQTLPYAGPSSLGVGDLKPVNYWPADDYTSKSNVSPSTQPAGWTGGVLRMSLVEALQVAAQNSRDYQSRKETIFTGALSLELERDSFRTSFTAAMTSSGSVDYGGEDPVANVVTTPQIGASRKFANGAVATVNLALDLAKLLTQPHTFSADVVKADATISMPLLRGSGAHIVMEPLTQAERNVAYDLLEFEQYKRSFAVSIASSYLAVLQQIDTLKNQRDSYERIIRSTRYSRRMADSGRLSEIQYDQAFQSQLSGRESWISAQQSYQRQLDAFKVLLGLPPDAQIELDSDELRHLAAATTAALKLPSPLEPSTQPASEPGDVADEMAATTLPTTMQVMPTQPSTAPSMDEEVVLEPLTHEGAGRYELPEEEAIRLALENRPDLRTAQGDVYDAQRKVVVAADALRAGLNVNGSASVVDRNQGQINAEKGRYGYGATLDLPMERTAQQNSYRSSLISLERATRSVQQLEDDIKTSIRNALRRLAQSRESLKTQTMAVNVAQRQVRSTDLQLKAGRIPIRDVLDAQSSLVSAQNKLTSALVTYRVAELELQRDLGVLEVNHEGLWREYTPEGRLK